MAGVSGSNTDEAADEEADDKEDGLSRSGVLRDDYYKNWVKGAEGLVLLQNGLAPFVDREIYNKHVLFLNKLPPCNQGTRGCQCTFKNILPDHAITSCNLPNCFCKEKSKKRRKCPNKGCCSTFCNLILNEHRQFDPLWKNSDINVWPTDHWSIAKCYMTTPTPSNSAKTTDASGLLSVIINGKFFQSKVTSQLGKSGDIFLKAREMRNDILHRAKMELTDAELQDTIDTCIAVLKDPTSLLHDRDAVLAVKRLESLRNDELNVTTEEQTRLLHERTEALRQMKHEVSKGIQKLKEEETERKEALRQMTDDETVKSMQKVEETRSEAVKSVDKKINQVLYDLNRLNEETMQKVQETGSGTLDSIHERKNEVLHDLTTFKEEMMQRIKEVGSGAVESIDEKLNIIVNELGMFREDTIKTIQSSGSAATESVDTKIKKVTEDLRKIVDEAISNKTDAAAVQRQVDELGDRLRNTEAKIQIILGCKENRNVGGGPAETKQETLNQELSDIRRQLANHLWKHYTTTSLSPLKTRENDIRIDEVYTEANMIIHVEGGQISLKHYSDIFETEGARFKRIYVLGEVGTGKTAICQMLINTWCTFIFKDSQDDSDLMQMMKHFDFVFYLPLRSLQTSGNLKEMIKWYYKYEVSKEMVDYILSELPEKCLILADGLDEWKPSPAAQRPIHVTDGIPEADDIKDVTLITTSRPSASGVLNMKATEYDRKIILSGIKGDAVDTMAQRYCAKLKATNEKDILRELKYLPIKDIENMPLILKHIVWMLAKEYQISPGITGLYSDLVKIAMKWAHDKYKPEINNFELSSRFSELRLPEKLIGSTFIEESQNLLFSLSQIAFEMLSNNSSQTFGRCNLTKHGIGNDQVQTLLDVGLLSEEIFDNTMGEDTKFCFPHTSFIEYFSAIFVVIHVQSGRAPGYQLDSVKLLNRLFEKCRSIEDVLPMDNILNFVCGLAPDLTQCVCQNIYSIAQSDKRLSRQRDFLFLLPFYHFPRGLDLFRFSAKCVKECKISNSSVTLKVPMLDYFVSSYDELDIAQHIDGQSVQHLFVFEGMFFPHSALPVNCSEFEHVKTIHYLDSKYFSDFQRFKVYPTVKNLQMSRVEKLYMQGRIIPEILAGDSCEKLQSIKISDTTLLKHGDVSAVLNLISHTTTLCEINISRVKCLECIRDCHHVMDLSQHEKLQTLKLKQIDRIFIKDFNVTNLEYLQIEWYSISRFCEATLRQKIMKFWKPTTEFYDLTTLDSLYHTFTKTQNYALSRRRQTRHLWLWDIVIQDDALQLHRGMENLSLIQLDYVSMSVATFIKFVESLLTLRQPVRVRVWLKNFNESDLCMKYLRNYPGKFRASYDDYNGIEFETLKESVAGV